MYTSCQKSAVSSCFSSKSSSKPNKPATKFPPRINRRDSAHYKPSQNYPFNEYYNTNQEMNGNRSEDKVVKSKPRALRMYNNFKKMKQFISPGRRVTTFITSLFTSQNVKRTKKEGKTSSTNASRSCFRKTSGKFDDFGVRKRVHFYPVSIVVDEECRPCGQKPIYTEDFECDRLKRQPSPYQSSETLKSNVLERNKKTDQEAAKDVFLKNGSKDQDKDDDFSEDRDSGDFDNEESEDIDRGSSSDLFEIDHLRVFGNNRFCEDEDNDDDFVEDENSGDFDEGVDRVSDSSSDLFEIDHLGVFGNNIFCEEDKDENDNHNQGVPRGLPQNFKNLVVELARDGKVFEPILVMEKRLTVELERVVRLQGHRFFHS